MSIEESEIIEFFGAYGLEAVKIPESDEESPDFLIKVGNERILVELKTKFDSDALLKKREAAFDSRGIYERNTVIARSNPISNRIRKASSQLATQKKKYNAGFCFVFLLSKGEYQSEQIGEFETTLYGDKDIIPMNDDFDMGIKKCYYYTNSDFFNHKNILDGAFLLAGDYGRLCINNLSVNYPKSVDSEFVRNFGSGVLDPEKLEESGKAYMIRDGLDRKDEEALNKHICEKYKIGKVVPFNWPQITVTSRVELEDGE